jgi:hypothetical protein
MRPQVDHRPVAVTALIVLLSLLGIGAAVSAAMLIVAPDGHLIQLPQSLLANAPFTDFLVPGILLFVFIGVYPLIVAYSIWRQPSWNSPNTINPFRSFHWSWAASLAAGVALLVWITVQIQWVPIGFLHVLYLFWAAAILVIALLPASRRHFKQLLRSTDSTG